MVSCAVSSAIILVIGARQYPAGVRCLILICHYNETESTISLHIYNFARLDGIALKWKTFENCRFEKFEKSELKCCDRYKTHLGLWMHRFTFTMYQCLLEFGLSGNTRKNPDTKKKDTGKKRYSLGGIFFFTVSFFYPYGILNHYHLSND